MAFSEQGRREVDKNTEYTDRIFMDNDYSLVIKAADVSDERAFTCRVMAGVAGDAGGTAQLKVYGETLQSDCGMFLLKSFFLGSAWLPSHPFSYSNTLSSLSLPLFLLLLRNVSVLVAFPSAELLPKILSLIPGILCCLLRPSDSSLLLNSFYSELQSNLSIDVCVGGRGVLMVKTLGL